MGNPYGCVYRDNSLFRNKGWKIEMTTWAFIYYFLLGWVVAVGVALFIAVTIILFMTIMEWMMRKDGSYVSTYQATLEEEKALAEKRKQMTEKKTVEYTHNIHFQGRDGTEVVVYGNQKAIEEVIVLLKIRKDSIFSSHRDRKTKT
jgi:uncharacterized membrane protein YhiD involved in acid resistance